MRVRAISLGAILGLAVAGQGLAQSPGLQGGVGLVDMPDARMLPDGTVSLSFSNIAGTTAIGTAFQITPRIEGAYRFTTFDSFGPTSAELDASQFDLKVQVLGEAEHFASVAIGFRDLFGNAAFSSEYIVASKTLAPNLSVSAGLGWGRLASEAAFDNPFGGTRPNAPGGRDQGNFDNLFGGGDIGVFGGVSYGFGEGWTLKAEYSSDAYTQEVAGGTVRASPWNFGLEKQIFRGVEAGLYYAGGEDVGFRLSLVANPRKPSSPQDLFPGPAPFAARPADAKGSTAWVDKPGLSETLVEGIAEVLKPEGIVITAAQLSGDTADIHINNTKMGRPTKAIGRTARVLAIGMPPSVETFRITLVEQGIPVSTTVVARSDMEELVETFDAVPESWRRVAVENAKALTDPSWVGGTYPRLAYAISPNVPFGDYGSGLEVDFQLAATARVDIAPGLSVSGKMTQSLTGGVTGVIPSPGALPAVRSNALAFAAETTVLDNLAAEYVTRINDQMFGRVSAGYLESMFAGVSGEVLLKDVESPFAFGLDLSYAVQRDPGSFAGLGSYDVMTGHGSVYWDTGWNDVHAQLDVGRYLAGDWGSTVSVSRRFENGWEVSGYATMTDADIAAPLSQANKGVRVTIPLEWGLPWKTKARATIPFADASRDDGARLNVQNRLYDVVRDLDRSGLERNWEAFWQ